jgi:hypothetical protein
MISKAVLAYENKKRERERRIMNFLICMEPSCVHNGRKTESFYNTGLYSLGEALQPISRY